MGGQPAPYIPERFSHVAIEMDLVVLEADAPASLLRKLQEWEVE
jgi:hypothetical protein